jgi:hypothetical protein
MPRITITLEDTPAGGVSIKTDFTPAIGQPCSAAQAAALDIIGRTKREWGMTPTGTKSPLLAEVDIDAVHRTRDHVVGAAL